MPKDNQALRASVCDAYSAAALSPAEKHPFPVGAAFAASVGYDVDALPAASVEAFAGVSNVSMLAPMAVGMTVLDLGCGAGLDSVIASRRGARVIGLDFSAAMLCRARRAVGDSAAFVQASAECLPFATASIDLVLVNGIFNLNPAREQIFEELARVLKPGGHLAGAELILGETLPASLQSGNANWFS
jgi:arsenite methyltransferase